MILVGGLGKRILIVEKIDVVSSSPPSAAYMRR